MSSLLLSSSTPTIFFNSFYGKPPHFPQYPKTHSSTSTQHQVSAACNYSEKEKEEITAPQPTFDRRNLLMGMGAGMYGAANLGPSALATPTSGPDLSKCTIGCDFNTKTQLDVNCCPPFSSEIIDYKLPRVQTLMRYRPAAHLVTDEYVRKYKRAVELMKALPIDDPRSFYQQANVHCAYCNLSYEQTGDPQEKLQIHFCWHFYPWHRWYLYFYERILGKLIDDPTFGLPLWNWDNLPPASYIPAMYVNDDKSPLYNEHRNKCHLPPALADLRYSKGEGKSTPPHMILTSNMFEMYNEMIRTKTLEGFYGAKYFNDTPPSPGMGSIEAGSHTALHLWVGENTREGLDLGNLYSAGRDSLFFAHHTNIDRLWTLWRQLPTFPIRPKEFTCKDWLDANYLFYDENKQLVRVYVRDTLDQNKMGYKYQSVQNPWLGVRPVPYKKKSRLLSSKARTTNYNFPVKLDKVVKVLVERPKKRRSEEEKEKEEELLVIEGIEADCSNAVRFEVYLNVDVDDDNPGELIDKAEYVGGFGVVPHKNSTKVKSMLRLGLSEALEDLEIEDDETILVSLVPKAGGEDITIGGVKIVYVDYATENDN